MSDSPKIAIVGAGIVGLTTALFLEEEIRGARVTILADKFYSQTTSYVAAGFFRPGTSFSGPNEKITKKWINDSWDHWSEMLKSSEAPNAGVMRLSAYMFSKVNPSVVRNHLIEDIVPIYRKATEDELKLCGDDWKYGSFFSSLLIESKLYLPWATQKFTNNGGVIKTQSVKSFSDISDDYDIIMNCSGLGSRELCNDMHLVPIRGQVIKVKAPWLKTAFYGDYDAYILPGFSSVTLGGTRQYDSYNMNVCKHDAAGIMERCAELLPALKRAEVIQHATGLRPHRTPVRVEGEWVDLSGSKAKVVHCYGHGGYGVTCAPGTARHAVKIAKDMLMTRNTQSKL